MLSVSASDSLTASDFQEFIELQNCREWGGGSSKLWGCIPVARA